MSRLEQRLKPWSPKPGMTGATKNGRVKERFHPRARGGSVFRIPWFWTSVLHNCERIHFCCLKPTNLYNPWKLIKVGKEFYVENIFIQYCILHYFLTLIFNNFHVTTFHLFFSKSLRYLLNTLCLDILYWYLGIIIIIIFIIIHWDWHSLYPFN